MPTGGKHPDGNTLAWYPFSTSFVDGPALAGSSPFHRGLRDPDDECTTCGHLPDRCSCHDFTAAPAEDSSPCGVCGELFVPDRIQRGHMALGRLVVCSSACRTRRTRELDNERKRRKRLDKAAGC